MSLGHIAVRALIAYVYLLLMLRLRGKRAIAEASAFDFVAALILGDMVDNVLWAEVPVAQFLVAAGVLVVVDTLLSWASAHSDRFHLLIEGRPAVLAEAGRRNRDAMRGELVNDPELDSLLRLNGQDPASLSEIRHALLEPDGQLSLIRKPAAHDARRASP